MEIMTSIITDWIKVDIDFDNINKKIAYVNRLIRGNLGLGENTTTTFINDKKKYPALGLDVFLQYTRENYLEKPCIKNKLINEKVGEIIDVKYNKEEAMIYVKILFFLNNFKKHNLDINKINKTIVRNKMPVILYKNNIIKQ